MPGCAQHVIQRGNNREACFCNEANYKAYLSFLKDAASKYRVAIHAFVLMTNQPPEIPGRFNSSSGGKDAFKE